MNNFKISDLECGGNEAVSSEHLDRLAQEGVRFHRFYVPALGAPAQASLLTGRHHLRTGVSHNYGGRNFLNLEEKTIANIFRQHGYATGMWGLWQIGDAPGYYPWYRGFDDAFIIDVKNGCNTAIYNKKWIEQVAIADSVITNYALDFINKHQHQPFLGYVAFTARPAYAKRIPLSYRQKHRTAGYSEHRTLQYAAIDFDDDQIGRLISTLERLDLMQKTIIVVLSNNAPMRCLPPAHNPAFAIQHNNSSKGPLAEEATRSPLFIWNKNRFKPKSVRQLNDVSDLLPTLCDIAAIEIDKEKRFLDGRNFAALLKEQSEKSSDKLVFNYAEKSWRFTDRIDRLEKTYKPVNTNSETAIPFSNQILSVQDQDYKLLLNPGSEYDSFARQDGYALLNIAEDPLETSNLIDKKPEISKYLKDELAHWFDGILKSRHAFKMPCFPIGYDGKIENRFPACAAQRSSENVINAPFDLSHWTKTGDFAEYAIRIHTPGRYKIILEHRSQNASHATVEITLQNQKLSGRIADPQRVELHFVQLRTGESSLRLEIANLPDDDSSAFDKLVAILLVRI